MLKKYVPWTYVILISMMKKLLERRPIYSSGPYVFFEEAFKKSSRRFQDSLRRFAKTSSRHLQDVLKTSCENLFKTSSRRLTKIPSRRFQDVLSG